MSSYEELQRDGQFGAQGLRLLTALMRREARKMRVLEPHGGWSDSAADDLVQDFFLDRGESVTRMLYTEARNDEQFGALLCRSVKNWLIDRARGETAAGALRFRLEKLLPTRREFTKVLPGKPGAGRWTLAGGPDDVFAGDVEDLAKAGREVAVARVKWESDTRRAPVTDTASLVRLLVRIFEAAVGSLELGQIVYATRGRFHAQFANDITFDHMADPSERVASTLRAQETVESNLEAEEADNRITRTAVRLCARLSDDDLRILDVLDDPEQIAARLGVGRSQTYLRRKVVTAVLAELIAEDADRGLILAEAQYMALGPAGGPFAVSPCRTKRWVGTSSDVATTGRNIA